MSGNWKEPRKKAFQLFYSTTEVVLDALNDEQLGRWFRAIAAYEMAGAEPGELDTLTGAMFRVTANDLDRSMAKFQEVCERNKRNRNAYKGDQSSPVVTSRDQSSPVVTSGTDEERCDEKRRYTFIPPSIEEVAAYCVERHNSVDPEAFWDFYVSKNWMVGRNKMRDWRAAVRNWERSGRTASGNNGRKREHFDGI